MGHRCLGVVHVQGVWGQDRQVIVSLEGWEVGVRAAFGKVERGELVQNVRVEVWCRTSAGVLIIAVTRVPGLGAEVLYRVLGRNALAVSVAGVWRKTIDLGLVVRVWWWVWHVRM